MAEWKPFDLKWGRSVWYCSACEESTEVPTYLGKPMYNFCPMCGANMNMKKADGQYEPQTDWETEKRDNSLCYKCVKECDRRVLNRYTIECNQYEPKDEPQMGCAWK